MVKDEKYDFLEFIDFMKLGNWDYKTYNNINISYNGGYSIVNLGEVLSNANIKWVDIQPKEEYSILGVKSYGKGVYINRTVKRTKFKNEKISKIRSKSFILV